MTWWRRWCPGWQLPMAANGMETLEQRIVWYAWRTRQYIESLYICYLYKYDASNPYAHMHNCHPFCPLTLAHTHTPPCVGLNENGACWPNERELFTYAVSMCGSWEGRVVSIYTTYADPIKAREGSEKQTTNNFWGRFGAHTHRHTHTETNSHKKWLQRVPRFAPCLLPSAPSAAFLCNTSRAWHPSASMLNLILRLLLRLLCMNLKNMRKKLSNAA